MNWIALNKLEQLEKIKNSTDFHIIFKHSTRCPISGMAKRQFELESDLIPRHIPVYYLDLIQYRDISNTVAESWNVRHESPQVLLVQGNTCLYTASHSDIDIAEMLKSL